VKNGVLVCVSVTLDRAATLIPLARDVGPQIASFERMQFLSRLSAAAILLSLTAPVSAQRLTFGVITGASLTQDFQSGSFHFAGSGTIPDGRTISSTFTAGPASRQLIIGPKLELRLPWNFSVEVDALHRALHSRETTTVFYSGGSQMSLGTSERTHASWEFPVLAKYRLSRSLLHPFFEAGPSFRPAGSGTNVTHLGVTAGSGVELHAHGMNISPAIRFTHWKEGFTEFPPVANQNQIEFLVGIDRSSESSGWATAFGKRFSPGVLVGVGLGNDLQTDPNPTPFSGGTHSESNSTIAGLILEFNLYRNLFLEADGIYRPLHAVSLSTEAGSTRYAVLTWQFPVMAKYKFRPSSAWRPFAELGPSFRLDGNFNGPVPSHYGLTAGGGIEARLGRIKISPAVRYTRWGRERTPNGGGISLNEVETLVGFAF
jgi:hypothetical protein